MGSRGKKKLFHKSLSGSPAILMHSGKKRGEFFVCYWRDNYL